MAKIHQYVPPKPKGVAALIKALGLNPDPEREGAFLAPKPPADLIFSGGIWGASPLSADRPYRTVAGRGAFALYD